jgi:hypothetical protein
VDSARAGIYGGPVSTPPDPEKGQPYPGQQGQPTYGTGYGGVQYPYPAGDGPTQQTPYPGQPHPGQPGPGQPGPGQPYPGQSPQGGSPYPYNPYAQASPYGQSPYGGYPAGMGDRPAPVSRPGIMVVGLVLSILSALPFLAFGVLFLVVPLDTSVIPPELLDAPELAQAGLTPESLLSFLRVFGGIFAALALIYILFAVLAFTGRNWARILLAVMTGSFSVFLVFGAVSGGAADPASAVILLAPVALAVGGAVILFLAPSNAYFSRPRA